MLETKPDPLRIRTAEPEDAEVLASLSAELGYPTDPEVMKHRIVRLNARPEEDAIFLACLRTRVVGWIHVSILQPLQADAHALIGGLVITDDCRGAGIGASLIDHVEAWAKQRGVSKMRVTSRINRDAAHRFYLREGYLRTKTSAVFEKNI